MPQMPPPQQQPPMGAPQQVFLPLFLFHITLLFHCSCAALFEDCDCTDE
jgi:hypothetical protein